MTGTGMSLRGEIIEAFGVPEVTTKRMQSAINDWMQLYYGQPVENENPCQMIPYTIVDKLTKATFSEYTVSSGNKETAKLVEKIGKKKDTAMQRALMVGQAWIKPYINHRNEFGFTIVPRNNALIFGWNDEDEVTDIGTVETTMAGGFYYYLLERRTVDSNGYLRIQNKLYRAKERGTLGDQVALGALPKYAEFVPEYIFQEPIYSIGMAPLRTPITNCIDGSPDSVSVYAAATRLIHDINRNEFQMCTEYDNAESRIMVSDDLLSKEIPIGELGFDGGTVKGRLKDHVFVGLDDGPEEVPITIYSPPIRDAAYLARKTEYLRNVETTIGMKRGLLSEVEAEPKTATEITSSTGGYNLTIIKLQAAWEAPLRETLRICALLGKLYNVNGAGQIQPDTVAVDWGNGVLYDRDKKAAELLGQVSSGLLKPEIYLGWYYNMPTETDADLQAIREKYMPAMERLVE